jgi:hypothetical protein
MTQVKVDIRQEYTVKQSISETDPKRHNALAQKIYKLAESNDIILGPQVRRLAQRLARRLAAAVRSPRLKELQDIMGKYNDGGTQKPYSVDSTPPANLFAMQLNDPLYNLTLDLNSHTKTGAIAKVGPIVSRPTQRFED